MAMGAGQLGVSDMSWHTQREPTRTSPTSLSCARDWSQSAAEMTSRFKAWSFSYGKLLLFSICDKLFLPYLSNLGNTNSPDIIIKVKNTLKCLLHDFSRSMSSNRAKMLLLYGKCLLCLTGTSWSSSVLRGGMGPQAVLSVEFCPQNWSKPL